jgi:hypothetical protein
MYRNVEDERDEEYVRMRSIAIWETMERGQVRGKTLSLSWRKGPQRRETARSTMI